MQRKSLQPYVVYAYGWTADGSAALPLVLLKVRETYQRLYGGEIQWRPTGTAGITQAGRRRSETGYLAVLGSVDTPVSQLEKLPQGTDFLDLVVRRDYRLEDGMRATLITLPGYINGPWSARAEAYEASRQDALGRIRAQEERDQAAREQRVLNEELALATAGRLTAAGYRARYEYGGIILDVGTATSLAADLEARTEGKA
jgi:hypothetical protein